MVIDQIKVYKYSVPLAYPLVLNKSDHIIREGLLIYVVDQDGHVGWGEIAPLPAFSTETLAEATNQIRSILPELKQTNFDSTARPALLPSVSFGLEMAFDSLAKSQTDNEQSLSLPLNCLITTLDKITQPQILELTDTGYKSFKIKIGRTAEKAEIAQLELIAKCLPSDCKLRLDANRTFGFNQAIDFCHRIKKLPIEYIEEPLTDPIRLSELTNCQSIPIALDESLLEPIGQTLIGKPGIKACVLKPTLIGGLNRTMELAKLAQAHNMTIVISSSYESSLTINWLGTIAHTLAPDTAHGLDTLKQFRNDVVSNPPSIEHGYLKLRNQNEFIISNSLLSEVASV